MGGFFMLLRLLVRDRRIWLFLLLTVLAVVISRFSLSGQTAITWVVKGGYWAILLAVWLFGTALWRTVRDDIRRFRVQSSHLVAASLIAISGFVLLAHERYGFKILADEELLVGTSMGMHYNREVAFPSRATDIQGPFQLLDNVLDKRPFFYPFVVSLVHDLTGYRPENAFYVNTVLGFVFLALLYALGRKLGGSEWTGALMVLLFTGLPLLAQQMKGGGFDLLNLVMIATVLMLAIRFGERRDETSLQALCFAGVLLAFTRYESGIVLVPLVGLVVWAWWREQRIVLNWPIVIAPLFLTFCLLQNRVFAVRESAWELSGKPGATTPFGVHYIPENIGHALAFFFDTTGYQPNSPFFGAVGLLAVPFFGLWIVRVLRARSAARPCDLAVALVGLGLFGIWALLLLYFWGQFDHPVIRRLSLPVHLLMAISVVAVGALWLRERGWRFACLAATAALLIYSLPAMSRRAYAVTYSPAVAMEWRTEFLKRFPDRDYLVIDNDSTFWIAHQVPATPNKLAHERLDGLVHLLRNDSFSAMYVVQHFDIDPETGKRMLRREDDIGAEFELEPLWERRIQTIFIGRISRIKAIHQNGKEVARAGLVAPTPGIPGTARSPAEFEAAKKAYVDNWLKQLP